MGVYDMSRVNSDRLRSDPTYLKFVVCEKFKQQDSYNRGLITSSAFSRALQELGLDYGQVEVETIMQHCTITSDGYVHYKDLMRHLAPETPRGKKTTAGQAMFPPEIEAMRPGTESDRVANLKHAYSRWDRGLENNESFKAKLRALGEHVSDELSRLLGVHAASRNLPFGKFLQALQLDEVDGRRARPNSGSASSVGLGNAAGGYAMAQLEWQFSDCGASQASRDSASQMDTAAVRHTLCAFIDGRMPSVTFRARLQAFGIAMTQDLDRLIRRHDCDNSSKFQDFARHIFHSQCHQTQILQYQPAQNSLRPQPQRPPSPAASGTMTPMQSEGTCESSSCQGALESLASSARPRLQTPFASGGHWGECDKKPAPRTHGSINTPCRSGAHHHLLTVARDDAVSYGQGQCERVPPSETASPKSTEGSLHESRHSSFHSFEPPSRGRPPCPQLGAESHLSRHAIPPQGSSALERRRADSSGPPVTQHRVEEHQPVESFVADRERSFRPDTAVHPKRSHDGESRIDDHARGFRADSMPAHGSCLRRSRSNSSAGSGTASSKQQQHWVPQNTLRQGVRPGRRHYGYDNGQVPFGTSNC